MTTSETGLGTCIVCTACGRTPLPSEIDGDDLRHCSRAIYQPCARPVAEVDGVLQHVAEMAVPPSRVLTWEAVDLGHRAEGE